MSASNTKKHRRAQCWAVRCRDGGLHLTAMASDMGGCVEAFAFSHPSGARYWSAKLDTARWRCGPHSVVRLVEAM